VSISVFGGPRGGRSGADLFRSTGTREFHFAERVNAMRGLFGANVLAKLASFSAWSCLIAMRVLTRSALKRLAVLFAFLGGLIFWSWWNMIQCLWLVIAGRSASHPTADLRS
jgi:hypothetical protein